MARIVFFGTPALAVATLRALHDAGHEVVLVVSQRDKRRGRGNELSPSPVKAAAMDLGLAVTARVEDVLDVDADVGVLVAFGRLIKTEILERLTIVNLHPSLLPRWRGATPVEAALLAGDERTGICLMKLVEEMDAGPIYASRVTTIGATERSHDLYSRLFAEGNEILVQMLGAGGLPSPEPQAGGATYCGKFSNEDFRIDWQWPAGRIVALTRIGKPWTLFRSKRVMVLEAQRVEVEAGVQDHRPGDISADAVRCGDGWIRLVTVQPEGKGPMDARSWLNGVRPAAGERFDSGGDE